MPEKLGKSVEANFPGYRSGSSNNVYLPTSTVPNFQTLDNQKYSLHTVFPIGFTEYVLTSKIAVEVKFLRNLGNAPWRAGEGIKVILKSWSKLRENGEWLLKLLHTVSPHNQRVMAY